MEAKQRLLEETEAKLVTTRQRNGELESVCQRFERSLEEVSRSLQTEKETNRVLQTDLQSAARDREMMKVIVQNNHLKLSYIFLNLEFVVNQIADSNK